MVITTNGVLQKMSAARTKPRSRTPLQLTNELKLEVENMTAKVVDVGEMLDRLPQNYLITSALMGLQKVVTAVLDEQVNR